MRRLPSESARLALLVALTACAAPPPPAVKTGHDHAVAATAERPLLVSAESLEPATTPVATGELLPAPAVEATEIEPPPLVQDPGIYDPSGEALLAFHSQLQELEKGERKTVRVAVFGASHVASDLFTDVVRHGLQQRFGDGGPGFVLAGKPNRWHRHGRVIYERSRGFHTTQVRARSPKHDRYGLAGVALDTTKKLRGLSALRTRTPADLGGGVSHVELYYLEQPHGGRIRVLVDGKGEATVRTHSARVRPAYHRFEVAPGEHLIELRTQADGPVRLFGVVLESERHGVVVDTLGVPGARIRNQLYWEPDLFAEHLKRREPGLVVLAYGTNEAGDDDVPIADYEGRMRQVIARIQAVAPSASCLLIGPTDRPVRDGETGELADRPRTAALIATQQRVAAETGCGFFDLAALMGGPLSMARWVTASPALGAPDHIHLTARGYEQVGEILRDNLLRGFGSAETKETLSASKGAPQDDGL